MKKVKIVIEVIKFIGLIANVIDLVEYTEDFIRKHRKPKNVKGFKTEEGNHDQV